jgi:inhibitor of KinA sporulation pathway (predicted exonuclease)
MAQPSKALIQLAGVCIDLTSEKTLAVFDQFANPNEPLTEFITELTGIKQHEVDGAQQCSEVLTNFWKWTDDMGCKNICSWGTDHFYIIEESKKNQVRYPDKMRFLNLKEMATLLRTAFSQSKQTGGLKKTMELFDIKFEGRAHNALIDAQNTASLMLFFRNSFKKFLKIEEVMK